RLRSVVRSQRPILETPRQKRLRRVLGIRHLAPAGDPQILVQRLPIQRDKRIERPPPLLVILARQRGDHTAAGGGEHWMANRLTPRKHQHRQELSRLSTSWTVW